MQVGLAANLILVFVQTFQNILISKPNDIWCAKAKELLREQKFHFKEFIVSEGQIYTGLDTKYLYIKDIQNHYKYYTFPMIFLNKKFIKGYTHLKKMIETKEIKKFNK